MVKKIIAVTALLISSSAFAGKVSERDVIQSAVNHLVGEYPAYAPQTYKKFLPDQYDGEDTRSGYVCIKTRNKKNDDTMMDNVIIRIHVKKNSKETFFSDKSTYYSDSPKDDVNKQCKWE